MGEVQQNAAGRSPLKRFRPHKGSILSMGYEHYVCESLLGNGGFGDVFEVTEINTNQKFALKALVGRATRRYSRIIYELRIMQALQHDASGYFPTVRRIFADKEHDFIVMELLSTTLARRFKERPPPLTQIRFIFHKILCGLSHLRAQKIVHFDIKPENVMISTNGFVKIIDFSCAYYDEDLVPQMIIATTSYIRAPEVMLRYRITHLVDMWSLGISMLKMYLHRTPIFAAVEGKILQNHTPYMLRSLEQTFGPIPDHLLAESVEAYRFYQKSDTGHYTLSPDGAIFGCIIKSLMPFVFPESDDMQYETWIRIQEREDFLDLIEKLLVYENRLDPVEALKHPFFTMANVKRRYEAALAPPAANN